MGRISAISPTLPLLPIVIEADYAPQFNRIIDLLSRPTVPAWQVAIVGAIAGAMIGILAEPVKVFVVSAFKRRKLERRLVSDVIYAYTSIRIYHLPVLDSRLKSMNHDPKCYLWLCTDLQREINTAAFDHALKDPELFYELNSAHVLRTLYDRMIDLREGKKYVDAFETASLYSRLHLFLHLVEQSIADASLDLSHVPKRLPSPTKQRLRELANNRIKPHWQDEVKTHLGIDDAPE